MSPDEIRSLIEESELPFTIVTKEGRLYQITDKANIWIPEACKSMLGVATIGKGVVILRFSNVESVRVECELTPETHILQHELNICPQCKSIDHVVDTPSGSLCTVCGVGW